MHGARLRVVSGNLITARPLGCATGWITALPARCGASTTAPFACGWSRTPSFYCRRWVIRRPGKSSTCAPRRWPPPPPWPCAPTNCWYWAKGRNSATPLVKRSASSASATPTGCWSSTPPCPKTPTVTSARHCAPDRPGCAGFTCSAARSTARCCWSCSPATGWAP